MYPPHEVHRSSYVVGDTKDDTLSKNGFTSPAPLLGHFVSAIDDIILSFHRALLLSDRDIVGVVRRGDFNLSDFEEYDWHLMDCHQGLLLLTSDRCMIVFDLVSGSRLSIPRPHYI
jgi:hypothetical protein